MLTALRSVLSHSRKSKIQVNLSPAPGQGSACIEAWVFPRDPQGDPLRNLSLLNRSSPLVSNSRFFGESAYYNDRWAAQTTGIFTLETQTNPQEAWSLEEAKKEVATILSNAPASMDVWVLEHTSKAPGIRLYHGTEVLELPFDIPVNTNTWGPNSAAREWLLEHRRAWLDARPPEHPVRQALPQGPQAVVQAAEATTWNLENVSQAADTLIYMAQAPFSREDPEWVKHWTSERSGKEDWLRRMGRFEEDHTSGLSLWVPNKEFESAFKAVCQSIPSQLMTPEMFEHITKNLPIDRLPYFWLAHRSAEHFWEHAEMFWSHIAFQWKTERQYKRGAMRKGLISLTEEPIGHYGEHWAFDVFSCLPRAIQLTALEEALDDMIERAEGLLRWSARNNLHLLEPHVPDWPYWDLIREGLKDPVGCRSIRSVMRQNQLKELLPSSEATVQTKRF